MTWRYYTVIFSPTTDMLEGTPLNERLDRQVLFHMKVLAIMHIINFKTCQFHEFIFTSIRPKSDEK